MKAIVGVKPEKRHESHRSGRMTVAVLKKIETDTEIGPESNGLTMTPREFDRADFRRGWHAAG